MAQGKYLLVMFILHVRFEQLLIYNLGTFSARNRELKYEFISLVVNTKLIKYNILALSRLLLAAY